MLKSFGLCWVLVAACLFTFGDRCQGQEVESKAAQLSSNAAMKGHATQESPAEVVKGKLGTTPQVHRSGDLLFSGQFSPADLMALKDQGVKRVITLRNANETKFDEAEIVTEAGMEHVRVPFASEEALTDEVFDKVRQLLKDDPEKTLLHCGSANRVGGVWLPYRVLDQGVDVPTALKEAKTIGLRTPFIEQKALDYINRQRGAGSEKP